MSDFVKTMKDWRRMCAAYSTDDDDCCKGCRLLDYRDHGCSAIFEMDVVDWKKYENAIAKWAAEHPEPVYPTWGEWLIKQGVLKAGTTTMHGITWQPVGDNLFEPIPANIAEKLDLKPIV